MGRLIVFEGLDGAGHSTQAGLLEQYFKPLGLDMIKVYEPTPQNTSGQRLRNLLTERYTANPRELQKLFYADRKEHYRNVILPALKQDVTVICDRFHLTPIAFGSISFELDWLIKYQSCPRLPDMTIIMDAPPALCLERVEKRPAEENLFIESEKNLETIAASYRELAVRFPRTYLVDGSGTIRETREKVLKLINQKLGRLG